VGVDSSTTYQNLSHGVEIAIALGVFNLRGTTTKGTWIRRNTADKTKSWSRLLNVLYLLCFIVAGVV